MTLHKAMELFQSILIIQLYLITNNYVNINVIILCEICGFMFCKLSAI